jgi:membrane protein YqaA with SNARE-associated domain
MLAASPNPTTFKSLMAVLLQQQGNRSRTSVVVHLLAHLGGLGLVPLAILDSSIIPTFGLLDIVTAFLAATHADLWPYYASMATLGAMIGSYFTYKLGRRTGRAWLENKFGARRSRQVEYALDRWGYGAVFVSTVAPPPCPTALFLLAAGAFEYQIRKFFGAVLTGRALRYTALTMIAAHYGRHIIRYFRHPGQYLWVSLTATFVIILLTVAFLLLQNATPPLPEKRVPQGGRAQA